MLTKHNPTNKALTERDVDHLLSRYGLAVRCLDAEPFVRATTHSSYRGTDDVHGTPEGCLPLQPADYERMEHLGDAVVELGVTDYLHHRYPRENEAFLTQLRMKIVSGAVLSTLCARTGLNQWIIVSASVDAERGRERPCIMEDVFEAFCAAVFEAFGYPAARAWIVGVLEEHLDFADLISNLRCSKDRLFRHCQAVLGYRPRITSRKLEDGSVEADVCDSAGASLGTGSGLTVREAEIQACQAAWDVLRARAP